MNLLTKKDCLLCGTTTTRDFCDACYHHLPRLSNHHCPICLRPTKTSTSRCGNCVTDPPYFSQTTAALRYTFPVDTLIHALKYQTNLAIAPILAKLLNQEISRADLPDCIIPMPLHPNRLKERGFNQALELSRHIAKQSQIPLLINDCQRIKHTTPQTELPWKSRQKNMRNAFECKIQLTGKHVAVIDDVMTTGATLNELAKVLCQQGAKKVSNWVIARTMAEDAKQVNIQF